jgi:hypothetical protein
MLTADRNVCFSAAALIQPELNSEYNFNTMFLVRGRRIFRISSLVADRERALWASRFIRTIAEHQPSASIFGPSLIETLLASEIDVQSYRSAASVR